MCHRDSDRWKSSRFARFVLSYGVADLATELDIHPSAVYHWIRGVSAPRRGYAVVIQDLAHESGVRLTLDQIYQHSRDRLAAHPDCATHVSREEWLARGREMRRRHDGG
jgi:hypothetical protein